MPPEWYPLARDAGLLLLGGLVGWQREAEGRAAGLRTHVLVCGGSCLITLVSFDPGGMGGDKGRIAAQIVSGIGFLGAGVILRRGLSVRGLTTAATVWLVAGIGITVGAGGRFAALAVFGTLLTLLTLILAKKWEEKLRRSPSQATLLVSLPHNKGAVAKVIETLTEAGAHIVGFDTEEEDTNGSVAPPGQPTHRTLHVELGLSIGVTSADLTDALTDALPGTSFEWE